MSGTAHLLIIAAAVAISSVPILTTILILLSPNRSRSAVPFLIGWVVGIALTVSAASLVAQVLPTSRTDRQPDTAVGIAEIVVGAAVVLLGIVSFFRHRRGGTARTSRLAGVEGKLGPSSALGLGFILNLRPKGILLAMAGGLTLYAEATSFQSYVLQWGLYTLVASTTVALPIIVAAASPDRMQPRLVAVHDWLTLRGGVITSGVLAVVGILIIGMGIGRL